MTTVGTGVHTSVSAGFGLADSGWAAGAGGAGGWAESAAGSTLSANASASKGVRLGMGRILVPPTGASQPAPTSKRTSRTMVTSSRSRGFAGRLGLLSVPGCSFPVVRFMDLRPLHHRDYRLLYAAQAVSFLGTMVTYVALP